jgi:hypothetical protein
MIKLLIIAALMAPGFSIAATVEPIHHTNATESQETSATRQTYLQKIQILERQLADIDLKWNWVMSNPQEDSIAKAEGWYTFMDTRRRDLNAEVVHVKLEQLINYYNDILKFPETEQTIKIKLIPEMQINRKSTAPDYPDHADYLPATDTEVAALEKWIMDFPDQYTALTNSLESLVTYYL